MSPTSSSDARPAALELAGNLAAIQARIAAACAAAGRDASEITLIAVTKTGPPRSGRPGRSRPDRLRREQGPGGGAQGGCGRRRRRTPRSAGTSSASCRPTRRTAWSGTPTSCTPWTGSASSAPSAPRRAAAATAPAPAPATRAHLPRPASAWTATRRAAACCSPAPRGRGGDRGRGRARARRGDGGGAARHRPGGGVRAAAGALGTRRAVNPAATIISAGMSGDLEAAVASGATHLRIGTALLGNRSAPGPVMSVA